LDAPTVHTISAVERVTLAPADQMQHNAWKALVLRLFTPIDTTTHKPTDPAVSQQQGA
jgi:hypothetical protein